MRSTRLRRISAANIGPNRFHHSLTVSWQMSIPRSARRSSTFRNDSGYLNVHHDHEPDYLGRTVEIAKWVFHPRTVTARQAGGNFGLTEPLGELRPLDEFRV